MGTNEFVDAQTYKENDIDEDGDGTVNEADYANDADASTYKGNDIDSDGDGTVDEADDAKTLQGNAPSDLRSSPDGASIIENDQGELQINQERKIIGDFENSFGDWTTEVNGSHTIERSTTSSKKGEYSIRMWNGGGDDSTSWLRRMSLDVSGYDTLEIWANDVYNYVTKIYINGNDQNILQEGKYVYELDVSNNSTIDLEFSITAGAGNGDSEIFIDAVALKNPQVLPITQIGSGAGN